MSFSTRLLFSLGLIHTVACGEKDTGLVDIDNDGVVDSEDCDPNNAAINTSSTDTVGDGIDQNCDGVDGTDADGDGLASLASGGDDCDDQNADTDASSPQTFYKDGDGDGFGDVDASKEACQAPEGYVENADDCNDQYAELNPSAEEICDGFDNDCDGLVDDEDTVSGTYLTYTDADGDGFGDPATELSSCAVPEGNVEVAGDCNDAEESINPLKDENPADGIDQNCDGIELCYVDADEDSYGSADQLELADDGAGVFDCDLAVGMSSNWMDCDDENSAVHPMAQEICDDIDNDCDALIDDADDSTDLNTGSSFFLDNDGDGYGDAVVMACEQASNMVTIDGDCNDALASSNPMATDIVGDTFDQNCDGIDGTDIDDDGYASVISGGEDCNDNDPSIHPDAQEVCDDIDNDCDGDFDDADDSIDLSGTFVMYADVDGDGFGDPGMAFDSCGNTPNHVSDDTDCDDSDATTYPGAAYAQDASACLTDADGDGWGSGEVSGDTCFTINMTDSYGDGWNGGYIEVFENGTYMDSVELADGFSDVGEYCGEEAASIEFYFREGQNNFYVYEIGFDILEPDGNLLLSVPVGDAVETTVPTASSVVFSTVEFVDGDCDDSDPTINPDATEICDGLDNNCDDVVDEGVLLTYFVDNDGDGYGDAIVEDCSQPPMTALIDGDCNDMDATIHPMATEICDSIDQNCDGTVDEGVTSVFYVDNDGDGYGDTTQTVGACTVPEGASVTGGDCEDSAADVYPGAPELCDGLDNNCDNVVDEGMYTMLFFDADGDGYGDLGTADMRCIDEVDPQWTGDASDCDDTSADTYPGAAELEQNWD